MTRESTSPPPASTSGSRIGVATLRCEVCRAETAHRILRLSTGGRRPTAVRQGIARCQVCRTTHPFEVRPVRSVRIAVIRSSGPRSESASIELPAGTELEVHELAPGVLPPARVRKIELANGRPVGAAPAEAVARLWLVDETGPRVPVSLIRGASTVSQLLEFRDDDRLAIGGTLQIDGDRWSVVALRARGRTFQRPGDEFPAAEVARVYARRTASPPGGSSDWSRFRDTPSSRASSDSVRPRSRSSPGVTRKRSSPRR
jgi:uncharacterized Zn finger protein